MQPYQYHIVGSTGRTATTFIAAALNRLETVVGLHEGHEGGSDETETVLPPINLENFLAYKTPEKSRDIVLEKRNPDIVKTALSGFGDQKNTIVDVAYYNPTIASAILSHNPNSRYVGIIRRAEDFVRSAAFMRGEDIMAVGWPDPQKSLTAREQFIAMGRLRPLRKTQDHAEWKKWGTIERNIWLWRETNHLIVKTKETFPKRVKILEFEDLKLNPKKFWNDLLSALEIQFDDDVIDKLVESKAGKNRKKTGYQIGDISTWTELQKSLLQRAVTSVSERRVNTHEEIG